MASISMDCEMIGARNGESMVARVSLVNEHGLTLLDKYVKPTKEVGDYRTSISGITPSHLQNASDIAQVRRDVERLISGRILIGHSLSTDLNILNLSHPENRTRDLALYQPFKRMNNGHPASLKFLAKELLGRNIQQGQHSSLEDAKAAMDIYLKVANNW